jgi:hypothetical protein
MKNLIILLLLLVLGATEAVAQRTKVILSPDKSKINIVRNDNATCFYYVEVQAQKYLDKKNSLLLIRDGYLYLSDSIVRKPRFLKRGKIYEQELRLSGDSVILHCEVKTLPLTDNPVFSSTIILSGIALLVFVF